MKFFKGFHEILKGISLNFQENLTQFLKNFTPFQRIFHVIFKTTSRNFKENFTQFLREFHAFF